MKGLFWIGGAVLVKTEPKLNFCKPEMHLLGQNGTLIQNSPFEKFPFSTFRAVLELSLIWNYLRVISQTWASQTWAEMTLTKMNINLQTGPFFSPFWLQ